MILTVSAMGIASTVFGPRFRLYTIATIVLAGFGAWSAMAIPGVGEGLATPWVGVKERIFWYGYQSWVVLAVTLLRQPFAAAVSDDFPK